MERKRSEKGQFIPVHNGKRTRLYRVWCSMKERCNNPHNKGFHRYGGRGITVCNEWSTDFATFRAWSQENGYKAGLTIDRIDPNGNYEPSNCRWVTHAVQNRNYSRNHLITYQGKTMCLKDWSIETGINSATIAYRIKHGMTLDEVFLQKDRRSNGRRKERAEDHRQ